MALMQADFLDLNLLPRGRRRRSITVRRPWRATEALGIALFLFALLTLVPLTVLKSRNDRQLQVAENAIVSSRDEVRKADERLARESQLRQQTQALLFQADALEQQVRQLDAQVEPVSALIQPMTQALPPRVTITNVTEEANGIIRVRGEGGSITLVLEFAAALEQVPAIRTVTVVTVDRVTRPSAPPTAVTYTLELER